MEELNIDSKSYELPENNYYKIEFPKKQIVIGHTFNTELNHFSGWKLRYNGDYHKTSAFTIDADGKIYQHYNPKYFSDFINFDKVNESIISILLVNEGWLLKDMERNIFHNVNGNKFEGDRIIEKKWRGYQYWAPYTSEQFESLINLVRYICDKFDIYLKTIGHNTKVDNIFDFEGITFRSNYMKDYTDLSPAFDFIKFKNKLEIKHNENGKQEKDVNE